MDSQEDRQVVEQPHVGGGDVPVVRLALRWNPREASKRLHQLGFDPIAEQVELYDKLTRAIHNLTHLKDRKTPKLGSHINVLDAYGNIIDNHYYSIKAYAELMGLKQKCITDLTRFGYARTTEAVDISPKAIEPITIILKQEKKE